MTQVSVSVEGERGDQPRLQQPRHRPGPRLPPVPGLGTVTIITAAPEQVAHVTCHVSRGVMTPHTGCHDRIAEATSDKCTLLRTHSPHGHCQLKLYSSPPPQLS